MTQLRHRLRRATPAAVTLKTEILRSSAGSEAG
jgi:hypothetical protein